MKTRPSDNNTIPNLEQYAIDRDKQLLPKFRGNLGLVFGPQATELPCAFELSQAYLAANWYLKVLLGVINERTDMGVTAKLNITTEQQNKFVECLAKSIWYRLTQDSSLSISGMSPLVVDWSSDYIAKALKHAELAVDNSLLLRIFAYICQKGETTYQLWEEIGNCSEYETKNNNRFKPR